MHKNNLKGRDGIFLRTNTHFI